MYVGEFSIPVGACGAAQFLGDYIDIFEEYHWDWDVSCFPGGPHLEHGGRGPQGSSFELVCQKLTQNRKTAAMIISSVARFTYRN